MLKVIVADDEQHIIRLINALVDWNSIGLELVGTASNGFEAIELVNSLKPDILITDIRMPGCDGLELIKKVKLSKNEIEIIIISGYANFPYAQTAIKCGVGDYLLKPINKNELLESLKKIRQKITKQRETDTDIKQMVEKSQNAQHKMKSNFVLDILEDETIQCDFKTLYDEYNIKFSEGMFQTFCLKIDYDIDKINLQAKKIIFEKASDIITRNIQSLCNEFLFVVKDRDAYGILNFDSNKVADVKRILRDCLNQLIIQKSILGPVEFTISLSNPVKNSVEIPKLMRETVKFIDERIILGTDKILEVTAMNTRSIDMNIIDKYSRSIPVAVETLDEKYIVELTYELKQCINLLKNISGQELIETVMNCATMFLVQTNINNQIEILDEFKRRCYQCGSVDLIFDKLIDLQTRVISKIKRERENDELRPIRLAKQYIQKHSSEPITLEQVSEAVGLSSSYFSVLFKKEIGEGFAKYLIGTRMDQAKNLLRESNESISAICKLVGYNDIKHFNQTFEKATGLKPSAYRKLYG